MTASVFTTLFKKFSKPRPDDAPPEEASGVGPPAPVPGPSEQEPLPPASAPPGEEGSSQASGEKRIRFTPHLCLCPSDIDHLKEKARQNHLSASLLCVRLIEEGLGRGPWLREEELKCLAGAAHDLHRLTSVLLERTRAAREAGTPESVELARAVRNELDEVQRIRTLMARIVSRAGQGARRPSVIPREEDP